MSKTIATKIAEVAVNTKFENQCARGGRGDGRPGRGHHCGQQG